jgi:hypothetical protein
VHIVREQYVFRLDVPVDSTYGMRGSERICDSSYDSKGSEKWKGTFCCANQISQADSFDVIHRDKQAAIVSLIKIVDVNDVWMKESPRNLGLLTETTQEFLVSAEGGRHYFQRAYFLKGDVLGLIDHAHPAPSNDDDDPILSFNQRAGSPLAVDEKERAVSDTRGVFVGIVSRTDGTSLHARLNRTFVVLRGHYRPGRLTQYYITPSILGNQ